MLVYCIQLCKITSGKKGKTHILLSFVNTWLSLLVPLFCVWGRFSEVTCCRLEEFPLVLLVEVDLLGAKSFSFYLSGNLFDFWSQLLLIRQSCFFSFWNPFKWWIIFLLLFSKVWSFLSVVWFWDFSICNVMYLSVDLFFVEGEPLATQCGTPEKLG